MARVSAIRRSRCVLRFRVPPLFADTALIGLHSLSERNYPGRLRAAGADESTELVDSMNVDRRFLPPERASSEGNLKGSAPPLSGIAPRMPTGQPAPTTYRQTRGGQRLPCDSGRHVERRDLPESPVPIGPPASFWRPGATCEARNRPSQKFNNSGGLSDSRAEPTKQGRDTAVSRRIDPSR